MKPLILSAALVVALASSAEARTVRLTGDAARKFIARHFPNAEIPGEVKGSFKHKDARGRSKRGFARCKVPGMGERSSGAKTVCTLRY